MKTIDFAEKYIRFDKTSPVTGPFRIAMYPFLRKPMDASDDIRIKRLVILKASSCLGTVLGQIINAKRIACDVGDQIMVCQTEDDATKWTKTRGKEWLESIPNIERLVKDDKYAKTNSLWLFRHKFLIITGPSITAAQSDQVRYVQTDESHLDEYPPGRLVEFEKRLGARWDRQATHITTAANAGREVDQFYYQGSQEEWCWRCTKCNELVLPLWDERAKKAYNGERVFIWKEFQSETATLDSIQATCPYCHALYQDTSRERYSLQRDADYKTMNPTAPIEFASFQWAAWAAAHWMPWREFLAEHLAAIHAAKLGDLKPHEDFVKKRECRSYEATIPDLGDGNGSSNDAFWISHRALYPESLRVSSFDVQAGSVDEGFHLWAQCDEFLRDGSSKRIDYRKLTMWPEAKQFFSDHETKLGDVYIDAGHRMREVFQRCEEWGAYAMFSTGDSSFIHDAPNPRGKSHPNIQYMMPYSKATAEDAYVGKSGKRIRRWPKLPSGYCWALRWSKPTIGGYLMALKAGQSHYYGIPREFNPDYIAQLNSYSFVKIPDKKHGGFETILKQGPVNDHSFATSSMCITGAIVKKFFPLATTLAEQPKELETL